MQEKRKEIKKCSGDKGHRVSTGTRNREIELELILFESLVCMNLEAKEAIKALADARVLILQSVYLDLLAQV